MKDKEMAELLAGAYQRQYHHNTYPELSDNSEFVTSKEEIKEACMYMAQWKYKQMIDKACEWWENELTYPTMSAVEIDWLQTKIVAFKKAMEE